jgi:hypothetical protein
MKKIYIALAVCIVGMVFAAGCTDMTGMMPKIPKMNLNIVPPAPVPDPHVPAPTPAPTPTVVFPIPTPAPTSQFVFV